MLKIKIFTHQLKINLAPSLPKVVAYYKTHNIDMTFDVEETNVLLKDAVVDLFLPQDGKYDTVMYFFNTGDFALPGGGEGFTMNLSKTLRASYVGTNVTEDTIDYTWKIVAHELLHNLVYKIEDDEGVTIPNLLDNSNPTPYFKNDDPYATDSNFAQQWRVINPAYLLPLQSPRMPQVTLKRGIDDGVQCQGELSTGGFICKTLERSFQGNKPNTSAIPPGTYLTKWSFMPSHLMWHYQVTNVPDRSGIFIHGLNYYFDSKGCVGLGSGYADLNGDGQVDIINSQITLKAFETLMKKQDFTLLII